MPRSIVDIGWIPPLYYTAIKCRHASVRLHAVLLLETTTHREGFWDAHISAAVARTVMAIESDDFTHYRRKLDSFSLDQVPSFESPADIWAPADRRVSALEVVLPDSPGEGTTIHSEQAGQRRQCQCRIN